MMRFLPGLLMFAAVAVSAHAQLKTAQVVVHGKSVQLLPSNAIFVAGLGEVTSYFSTFNGTSGAFRIDTAKGGLVSGELRPRAATPGLYEGGYAQATPLVLWDYGSYAVSIPTSDSDSNGIPDVIQYDRDGNFVATGSGFSVSAGLTFSMSVRFSRAANSATGSYAATTQNALGQPNTVTGGYSLLSYQGNVAYSRGSTNVMNLSLTGLFQGGVTVTGSTSYTTANADSLSYGAFAIRDSAGVTYQVRAGTMARIGGTYRGTLSLVDGLPQTTWTDFTDYVFQITDANDVNANGVPDLTDPAAVVPVIAAQPRAQAANLGQSVTLVVGAVGAESYQWMRGGLAIPGGTNAALTFSSIQLADAGNYSVTVGNSTGSVTSNAVLLSVSLAPSRPAFTSNPLSLNLVRGNLLVLTAEATGTPSPTLQWRKGGVQIAGATLRNYTLQSVSPLHSGIYDCVATNSVGATTSSTATLSIIDTSTDTSRLSNLSIRTNAGSGAQSLITGFTVGGQATAGTTALLVRGAGPSLSQFGLTDVLGDPTMAIFSGSTIIAANNDWGGNEQIKSLAAQVGAFNFSSDASKDAAVALNSIATGGFSSQITDVGSGTGVALAEIYDVVPAFRFTEGTPRLINVSARAQAGSNADTLIAGFVVSGTTAKTLLIRAAGPALAVFGVPGVLSDPKLELFAGSRLLSANDDWAGNADISRVGASVGAFSFAAAGKDAALLVTLPPGNYSAQVSSANGEVGVALVEVYEVPHPIGNSFTTILAEPFSGTTLDSTVWQSIRPFAGSTVVPTTGGVMLSQRGTLVSINSFPSAITVSGQVSFNNGNEHFKVYLRSDGLTVAGSASAERTGVGCALTAGVLSIQQSGSAGSIVILTSKAYAMQTGRFYDFALTANGSSFSLSINGVTELTASSSYAPGNKIVFMNREFSGVTSTLRNVTVTAP